jgi:DNA-binding transcriptional ArsR family regulator
MRRSAAQINLYGTTACAIDQLFTLRRCLHNHSGLHEARCRDAQELQPHPKYASMHSIKYLLWWLISGTKGGKTRGRLILALRQRPANANQVAEVMAVDYKTVRHHLKVLQRNGLVTYTGEGYGATYFLSPQLDENFAIFEEIWRQIGEKQKRW